MNIGSSFPFFSSVIGLNFDFLSLNIVGFVLYSVFNVALYWIHGVQADYFQLHPTGVNPVQVRDVAPLIIFIVLFCKRNTGNMFSNCPKNVILPTDQ